MMKRTILLLVVLLAGACARPQAPPGGDPDRQPPGLLSTTPAALTRVTDLAAPVVFRFDERLRVRSFNRTFVAVMPGNPDDFDVRLRGERIEVQRRGGWLPGQIYHVVVRPGIEDLFGNRRTAPAELVFSTGPDVPPTALAGMIEDRITRQPARDVMIEAVRRGDSTAYRTSGDSVAFFALRHTPYGAYDVIAFSDRNRNQRLDPGEPRSAPAVATLGAGADTLQLMFQLLPHDTTPPRPARAESSDSLHVRITFDDYLDEQAGVAAANALIFQLPDSTTVSVGVTLQLNTTFEAAQRTRAAPDTTRRPAGDTARAAADTSRRTPPPTPPRGAAGRAAAPSGPVPDRTVVGTLSRPLTPGEYVILVQNARNVNGLVGGGSARFVVRPPQRPQADTTRRAPTDTIRRQR